MTRKILAAATLLTTWAVALFVALLAALLVAGPAHAHHKAGHSQGGGKQTQEEGAAPTAECEQPSHHPSGRDRCESPGGSGDQGKAKSDPDDDGRGPDRSNGGRDKPGGSGGVYKSDQDGNNGCGNDQDFEDDNEGLCLGPVKRQNDKPRPAGPAPSQPVPSGPSNPGPGVEEAAPTDEVLGEIIVRPAAPDDDAGVSVLGMMLAAEEAPGDSALGKVQAASEGEVLPVTGGSVAAFLLGALVLLISGAILLRLRRRLS